MQFSSRSGSARFSTYLKDNHVVTKARLTVRGEMDDLKYINNDHQSSPTTGIDMIRLIVAQLANVRGVRFLTFDFFRAYLQAKVTTTTNQCMSACRKACTATFRRSQSCF